MEKKSKLEEKWEMLRWIHNFIDKHKSRWEKERIGREKEEKRESTRSWREKKREEKVEIVREDMFTEWRNGEHLSRKEMGRTKETPSVAELSRMCKLREDKKEPPRVEQISRMNLPGPSLE